MPGQRRGLCEASVCRSRSTISERGRKPQTWRFIVASVRVSSPRRCRCAIRQNRRSGRALCATRRALRSFISGFVLDAAGRGITAGSRPATFAALAAMDRQWRWDLRAPSRPTRSPLRVRRQMFAGGPPVAGIGAALLRPISASTIALRLAGSSRGAPGQRHEQCPNSSTGGLARMLGPDFRPCKYLMPLPDFRPCGERPVSWVTNAAILAVAHLSQ
jgi:hypothetical protein